MEEKIRKDGKLIFFTCCDILYDKGILHLLKAIQRLDEKQLLEFRIAGKGENLDEFKAYSLKSNLSHRVIWLGEISRERVAEELQNSDCFILPSLHENMPVAIIEAIACGKPVISTICGGPEFIINEQNGILIPPDDIDAIYQAILKMIKEINKFDSKAIREDFEKRFSFKVVSKEIKKIYDSIIFKEMDPNVQRKKL